MFVTDLPVVLRKKIQMRVKEMELQGHFAPSFENHSAAYRSLFIDIFLPSKEAFDNTPE